MEFYKTILRTAALGALVAALALPALADDALISLHGFGGWAYGRTNGLTSGIGTERGTYDNAEFALNIAAKPSDKLSLVAQTRLTSNGTHTDLDYAFAEWSFSDALKLRVGRVKHPFGIYGEVFDVGTLRPFYTLPQGLYGPNGYTARAYNGMGLTGNVKLPHRWALQYDVYGGEIVGDFEVPGLISTVPSLYLEPKVSIPYHVQGTLGGRVNISTPLPGLSVGASAYAGNAETELSSLQGRPRRNVSDLHLDYSNDRLTIRAEKAHLKNGDQFTGDASYIEGSYHLTDHWQVAVRRDTLAVTPDVNLAKLPKIFGQLLKNTETGVSLSYWFRPNFVMRGSIQEAKGGLFAYPATSAEVGKALSTNILKDKARLYVFGAQFSF